MSNTTASPISCGHCNNISLMKVKGTVNDIESYGDPRYITPEEEGTVYNVLECPACKKINIASFYWSQFMDPEKDIIYDLLYPQEHSFPIGLPEGILTALKAADRVKSIDANAYTLLLGRTLELVCLDREAKGGNLFKMLEDLASRGEIPEKLVDVANGLRQFRNIGAHAGIGELGSDDIPIVKSLCYAILEYIYSAPHLAAQAELNLKKIKKK